jgi:hypothetical protein
MNGQLHAPTALPQRKEPLVPIVWDAEDGAQNGLEAMEKRKITCSCRESNFSLPGSNLVTIELDVVS